MFILGIFEVYSIGSSNMVSNFPNALNFNQLFLKLDWFIYNLRPVLHIHCTSMFN